MCFELVELHRGVVVEIDGTTVVLPADAPVRSADWSLLHPATRIRTQLAARTRGVVNIRTPVARPVLRTTRRQGLARRETSDSGDGTVPRGAM